MKAKKGKGKKEKGQDNMEDKMNTRKKKESGGDVRWKNKGEKFAGREKVKKNRVTDNPQLICNIVVLDV